MAGLSVPLLGVGWHIFSQQFMAFPPRSWPCIQIGRGKNKHYHAYGRLEAKQRDFCTFLHFFAYNTVEKIRVLQKVSF